MSPSKDAVAQTLGGYKPIIRRLVVGDVSADEFESEFLAYFKDDENQVVSDEFEIRDGLFGDVDEYVGDPQIRAASGGIDADELRSRAQQVYARLYGGS